MNTNRSQLFGNVVIALAFLGLCYTLINSEGFLYGVLGAGFALGCMLVIWGSFRYRISSSHTDTVIVLAGFACMVPLPTVFMVAINQGEIILQIAYAIVGVVMLLVILYGIWYKSPTK